MKKYIIPTAMMLVTLLIIGVVNQIVDKECYSLNLPANYINLSIINNCNTSLLGLKIHICNSDYESNDEIVLDVCDMKANERIDVAINSNSIPYNVSQLFVEYGAGIEEVIYEISKSHSAWGGIEFSGSLHDVRTIKKSCKFNREYEFLNNKYSKICRFENVAINEYDVFSDYINNTWVK